MVGKCANPECPARFHYLHEGRLFQVDMRDRVDRIGTTCEVCGKHHHVRYFWLCENCARAMTLSVDRDGSVRVVANPNAARPSGPSDGEHAGEAA